MKPVNKHFDGKTFFNKKANNKTFWDVLKWRFLGNRPIWPKHVKTHSKPNPLDKIQNKLRISYIGHASLLIQANGVNIVTDPLFSDRASPFRFLGPKRVQAPGISLIDLPKIDMIFVSHNHYDHLDLPSLKYICKTHKAFIVVPLGNDKIIHNAIPEAQIKTLDWFDKYTMPSGNSIQLIPTQHWSRRYLWDTNEDLWGGALFEIDSYKFLFISDTGFNEALFQEIHKRIDVDPDIVALPIGSYDPRWFMSYAHMNPEEAWQTFKIFKAKYAIPTHYDIFRLGDEPYGEALPRFLSAAKSEIDKIIPLKPGEHFDYT